MDPDIHFPLSMSEAQLQRSSQAPSPKRGYLPLNSRSKEVLLKSGHTTAYFKTNGSSPIPMKHQSLPGPY